MSHPVEQPFFCLYLVLGMEACVSASRDNLRDYMLEVEEKRSVYRCSLQTKCPRILSDHSLHSGVSPLTSEVCVKWSLFRSCYTRKLPLSIGHDIRRNLNGHVITSYLVGCMRTESFYWYGIDPMVEKD